MNYQKDIGLTGLNRTIENNPSFSYVFDVDTDVLYILKKCERIAAALYLVTNLLVADEPMRKSIRQIAINFISQKRTCFGGSADEAIKSILLQSQELLDILFIGKTAGLISIMNFEIMTREVSGVVERIARLHNVGTKDVLAPDFFDVKDVIGAREAVSKGHHIKDIDKGHKKMSVTPPRLAKLQDRSPNQGAERDKEIRIEKIQNMLKSRSHLNIKDFSLVIKDCSEKTIQRDLLSLVEKGVLKKEGERRWSTYSII